MANYMDAAAVAEAIRDAAVEALVLDHEGLFDLALTRSRDLARAHPGSAVAHRLVGELHYSAAVRVHAERECRRALDMDEPNDPRFDCIPPESISGENRGARLVSLACEFHELLSRILVAAGDYWDSMSSERQRGSFQQVSFDVLENEYRMVDAVSYAFAMSDVRRFVEEHKSWRFWDCPICDRKRFMDSGMLLSHMCSKHPRAVLPRLQSIVDPTLIHDEALEDGDFLGGVTFSEDSAKQDMICFNKTSEVFKWLFYAPSSGVGAKSIPEMREMKREKGYMFLESIKEKMKTLPTDKSSTEFSEALPKIQELWHEFLKASVFDYRAAILGLARSFLWRELKKCMTKDPEQAAKFISATDIDAIFAKEVEPSHAEEDHETSDNEQSSQTDGALMVSDKLEESDHVKDENDLGVELDKLHIDPKIIENSQERYDALV